MPGLSVAYGDAGAVEGAGTGALDATKCFDHYETERFDLARDTADSSSPSAGEAFLGRTDYDGYPIRRFDTDHGVAVFEGRLYDVEADSAIEDADGESEAVADRTAAAHVERVAAMVAADDREGLREWVGARDGDFLLAIVDDATITIVNDAFARLPAYYATIDGTVVCSRELGFVREFARSRDATLALDRLAVGQLLAFGYPLGTRTPFEGVQSVPPGSMLQISAEDSSESDGPAAVEIDSLYEHDFEDCEHADRSIERNADELVDRLTDACRRRVDADRPSVVSLSGGLDSRTVGGIYAAEGLPATAATFQQSGDRNSSEVAAAGAVADHLDLDWTVHSVESSPARRETLLRTKQGLNYLGMAFVLDFFEQLRDRHGTATYVTGDGGDKLLVGLEPTKSLDSTAALVDHVIEANSRLSLSDAAAIANVDPDAIRASVAERIDSYPEADPARAYVHFLVRERGVNLLLHGEDRNRYYVWSVSPFYALPVFEYAMNCPDEQKDYRRLQSAILERLDPGLVDLPYPNYGAAISTRRYRAKQFVYDALERYPGVRERVVDLVTGDDADALTVADAIREDLPQIGAAGLDPDATTEVLATPGAYDAGELEFLATVTGIASTLETDGAAERPHRGGPPSDRGVESDDRDAASGDRDAVPANPDTVPGEREHAARDDARTDPPVGDDQGRPDSTTTDEQSARVER